MIILRWNELAYYECMCCQMHGPLLVGDEIFLSFNEEQTYNFWERIQMCGKNDLRGIEIEPW